MGESEISEPGDFSFKRSTMYSFPVEVKITSPFESTKFEVVKVSPKKR